MSVDSGEMILEVRVVLGGVVLAEWCCGLMPLIRHEVAYWSLRHRWLLQILEVL